MARRPPLARIRRDGSRDRRRSPRRTRRAARADRGRGRAARRGDARRRRARASRRSPTRAPAVALVDLHLPDDDGLSLCLRTRALPRAAAGGHLLGVRRRRPRRARRDRRRRRRAAQGGVAAGAARRRCAASCGRALDAARAAGGRRARWSRPTWRSSGMLAHGVARRRSRRRSGSTPSCARARRCGDAGASSAARAAPARRRVDRACENAGACPREIRSSRR